MRETEGTTWMVSKFVKENNRDGYRPKDNGRWSRSKKGKFEHKKNGDMIQINRIKGHLPQEGKNNWLILFSASYCFFSSQV
jgi:hypothetical protein